MTWQMPKTVESIPTKSRVCWNCRHCAKRTMYPGYWVGRCMKEGAADFGEYIWLERDTCGYFEMATREEK